MTLLIAMNHRSLEREAGIRLRKSGAEPTKQEIETEMRLMLAELLEGWVPRKLKSKSGTA
jgi:hypothetical protein